MRTQKRQKDSARVKNVQLDNKYRPLTVVDCENYIAAYIQSVEEINRNFAEFIRLADIAYAPPTFADYRAVIREIVRDTPSLHLIHLDRQSPWMRWITSKDTDHKAAATDLHRWCDDQSERVTVPTVDLKRIAGGRFWNALREQSLSFELTDAHQDWPLLLLRQNDCSNYCHQYVDSVMTYSRILKRRIDLPLIYHRSAWINFEKTYSFLHEMIHVIQRVCRRNRTATYLYLDAESDKTRCRRHELRIAWGITDELEVQQLLATAYPEEYAPSLAATTFHVANLSCRWKQTIGDNEMLRSEIEAAIELIDFHRFAGMFPNVKAEISKQLRDAIPPAIERCT